MMKRINGPNYNITKLSDYIKYCYSNRPIGIIRIIIHIITHRHINTWRGVYRRKTLGHCILNMMQPTKVNVTFLVGDEEMTREGEFRHAQKKPKSLHVHHLRRGAKGTDENGMMKDCCVLAHKKIEVSSKINVKADRNRREKRRLHLDKEDIEAREGCTMAGNKTNAR